MPNKPRTHIFTEWSDFEMFGNLGQQVEKTEKKLKVYKFMQSVTTCSCT